MKKIKKYFGKVDDFFLILISVVILLAIFSSSLITINKRLNIGTPKIACTPTSFSGRVNALDNIAVFEGQEIEIPQLALVEDEFRVLSMAYEERWIEVDLSEQKLKAWEGNDLYLETSVSTGLPWWPTPTGEFRIWIKLRATKMEGGSGEYYYYLPNVPYVMFIENSNTPSWRGYGLHGTYWHNDFGTQRSHGCVNLPTPVARDLYYWASPSLVNSKWVARSTNDNPGTKVVIHE